MVRTYQPCRYCGAKHTPPSESISYPVHFDAYRWNVSIGTNHFERLGQNVQIRQPNVSKGVYTVSGGCQGLRLGCETCRDAVLSTTHAVMSELSVVCNPWVGLDRTDLAPRVARNLVKAVLDPEQEGLDCEWINGSIFKWSR